MLLFASKVQGVGETEHYIGHLTQPATESCDDASSKQSIDAQDIARGVNAYENAGAFDTTCYHKREKYKKRCYENRLLS